MNVILLGNYPNDENESMTRYAEMLRDLLSENGCRVEILRPEPVFGRRKRSVHGLGKWLGYVDKYLLFPFVLRRHLRKRKAAPDKFIVHICDQANAVYTRWLKDVPHVVTCHDVMAILSARGVIPGQKTGWTGRVLQSWILSGLRHAGYVICVSEETRRDLLSIAPELENRSTTIENPLNYPYVPLPREQATGLLSNLPLSLDLKKDRFLLHVGGNQWYKNREGVIRIYAQLCASHPDLVRDLSLKLVMVGKPPTDEMLRLASEKGLNERAIFITDVSNQQLCSFYSLAEILIYPSHKEGFGWPIIEAQACGCPVVASDRPPMNRLAGSAACLIDPEDERGFVDQIVGILSENPEILLRRKKEALSHSRTFDRSIFVNQLLAQYNIIFR